MQDIEFRLLTLFAPRMPPTDTARKGRNVRIAITIRVRGYRGQVTGESTLSL